jgi:hypothetical protein
MNASVCALACVDWREQGVGAERNGRDLAAQRREQQAGNDLRAGGAEEKNDQGMLGGFKRTERRDFSLQPWPCIYRAGQPRFVQTWAAARTVALSKIKRD